jgi:hypothetical protein
MLFICLPHLFGACGRIFFKSVHSIHICDHGSKFLIPLKPALATRAMAGNKGKKKAL